MFDIGWSEILVIAVVAIVVVGPRDLPRLMRTVGQWVTKGRRMARELQSQLNEAIKEAELDDVGKEMTDLTRSSPGNSIRKAFEPVSSAMNEVKRTVDEAGQKIDSDAAMRKDDADPDDEAAKVPAPPAFNSREEPATVGNGSAAPQPQPAPEEVVPAPEPAAQEPVEVASGSADDDRDPPAQRAAVGS